MRVKDVVTGLKDLSVAKSTREKKKGLLNPLLQYEFHKHETLP